MPQVSVVISSYNRRRLLAEALRSALAQSEVDLEVIVVDNGSTDGTEDDLAAWRDARLRVIRNPVSLGSVGGRNTGLAAASGEWVGFLDDDDLWSPDKLRAQLEAAERPDGTGRTRDVSTSTPRAGSSAGGHHSRRARSCGNCRSAS
jgi:glycosyltransferase involved in cell wall biosynthesis